MNRRLDSTGSSLNNSFISHSDEGSRGSNSSCHCSNNSCQCSNSSCSNSNCCKNPGCGSASFNSCRRGQSEGSRLPAALLDFPGRLPLTETEEERLDRLLESISCDQEANSGVCLEVPIPDGRYGGPKSLCLISAAQASAPVPPGPPPFFSQCG